MILLLNGGVDIGEDGFRYLDKLKENMAFEEQVTILIDGGIDWERTNRCLEEAAAIVLVCGVCMDGIPSHVLQFLEAVEREVIGGESIPGKFYAILYTDLYEGEQTGAAMSILKSFCRHANITWGRGLGIGGNRMQSGMKWGLMSLFGLRRRIRGCLDVPLMEHAMFIRERMQGKDGYISSAGVSRANYMRYVNRASRKKHA